MDDRLSILSPPPELAARAMQEEIANDFNPLSSGPVNIPGLTGIGLGPIDPKLLTREAWPLHTAEQLIQYRKFVQLLINRVRGGESNDAETERFIDMFNTPSDWIYVIPALGMLPELDEHGPLPLNQQMATLLEHVKSIVDMRHRKHMERIANKQIGQENPPMTVEAVTEEVRARISKLLLGPYGEIKAPPAVKRLLASWVEQVIDKEKPAGIEISRDSLGLPSGLKEQRPQYHNPEGREKPAPVTVYLNRKPPSPIPKALPSQPVPVEYLSSDEAVEPKRKTSYRNFPPTAGDSSVELSDSPSESLLQELTNSSNSAGAVVGPTSADEGSSFWYFQKPRTYKYEEYIRPVTEADRAIPQRDSRHHTPISRETTKEGTIIAKGFEKPPPAESDAILKASLTARSKPNEIAAD
ncbi:MAG: hypothetical protein Q9225_006941 [Loekoesia sp. 1 TL-2023]